jgi:isoaspartyl peptidase/L-asparaginase-like protein (Ntn-hydrolase superfamily)
MADLVLAVHGGAGRGPRSPVDQAPYHVGIRAALAAGTQILTAGGAALDAVEAAVRVLEDDPHFNAGRGSVLTADGTVEMDASLMDGARGRAAGVGAVRRVRHPVALARAVLEDGRHVLLTGAGADALAAERGLELLPHEAFETTRERDRWAGAHGTVGAVARDADGHLAAATSTGGTRGKRAGRIGDSAVVGAGTWADDATLAVSLTGDGEGILRSVAGHELAALVGHAGRPLDEAARHLLHRRLAPAGVDAGLVAVDARGAVCADANCDWLPRGIQRAGGEPWSAVVLG